MAAEGDGGEASPDQTTLFMLYLCLGNREGMVRGGEEGGSTLWVVEYGGVGRLGSHGSAGGVCEWMILRRGEGGGDG